MVQETWVQTLGQEDPLEKEKATYSSILAWKITWTEEPGGLQSMGLQRVRQDWATDTYLLTFHLSKCLTSYSGQNPEVISDFSVSDPNHTQSIRNSFGFQLYKTYAES